ncbi:hypothetical protein ACIA8O_19775 [Kitasatospora sp. NPDC051853]|uniref:hypothetical protein n=1 Tax=Kitasatospora sp. NPDC051853 TaxID=3364058 RepID=UPI0037A6F86C
MRSTGEPPGRGLLAVGALPLATGPTALTAGVLGLLPRDGSDGNTGGPAAGGTHAMVVSARQGRPVQPPTP